MNISARNTLKGTIIDIQKGQIMAKVVIDLGNGQKISSVITSEGVDELDLKVGDQAYAVIKSTEVIIGK
jgi:molybdopterin-binding protein